MLDFLESSVQRARQRRWLHLVVANLRILIGFAFLPAGLKKVLAQPFTDAANVGPFHDFLRAFYATGEFYQFVGTVQLVAAALLMTQRFATVGALIFAPILTALVVFCWSTAVYPTAIVVTLMWLGTVVLLLWDLQKWQRVFGPEHDDTAVRLAEPPPPIQIGLWRGCGAVIVALYLLACAWAGEVYRPRGIELSDPRFYLLPAIASLPLLTLALDIRMHRRSLRRRR